MMEREMQMKSVKKFRAFLGGFILFLALMFTVGSVNVKAAAPKLNKKKITIYVGHTGKLKVNNARKKVKWTSSKKQIAAVSSKGVVKGKKAGSAVITAAAGNKKWTCKVTAAAACRNGENPAKEKHPLFKRIGGTCLYEQLLFHVHEHHTVRHLSVCTALWTL